jgi:predicted unusual protein kinase regulating ubiquinone biosynthesis (AarF/ABC1/UbiB family)
MLAAVGKGQCEETGHDMDLLVVKPTDNKEEQKEVDKIRAETTLRVCLVDAGMVAQLTEEESSLFVGMLCSLGQGDGRLAAKFALKFSAENHLSPEQEEAFAQDMDALFKEKCNGYGTNVDVGEVLRGVLGLIRTHRVRIDANYATLVVNCLCVYSLAMRVCPAYNVLDAAEPLLKSYFETFYEPDGTPKPRQQAIRVSCF